MSGFVALFDRTGCGVDIDSGERMHATLDHRGPDGEGMWATDRVVLGHQHFANTPQSLSDEQPRQRGDLVVTARSRLDNRPELADRLELPGDPTTCPDSDYLLAAYDMWGASCVDHLIGAFAFAIWDDSQKQLVCGRDHCGVTPCYTYSDDDVFAVASELKALLTLPMVDREINDHKIGEFLIDAFADPEGTVFEAIKRLPPAHATVVTETDQRQWQYWDLDPSRTVRLDSDAAYERRFRELFERAVSDRLRASGRVGTTLSGGIDSSSITVVACDQHADPIYTFSNVFDETPESDEREFIEPVIDREGLISEYISLDDVGVLVDRDAVFDQFDQPPHNTIHYGGWMLAKRARQRDVGVLLDGGLGDSAIGYGLRLLPHALRTGRWRLLWRELHAMSEVTDAPAGHLFTRHALRPLVPNTILRARRRRKGQPVLAASRNSTLDPTFVDRIDLDGTWAAYNAGESALTYSPRRGQYNSITAGNVASNFELKDLIGGAHGVEYRYPFTDPRLLEFTLAIPPSQQFADGWTRSIARRALDDLLPETVQWRPWKTYLTLGFWNSLAIEADELDRLADGPEPLGRFLDVSALGEAVDRFRSEPTSRDARSLWRALALVYWWEAHGPTSREPTSMRGQ